MTISRYLSQFADFLSSSGVLGVSGGGTGLTSTPSNGQLDIGNGSGFTRATLTQGTGISVTNGAGTITIAATATSFTNRIINGDMRIDQRNAGAQITAANLINTAYMVDRWAYFSSQAAKFTAQQNAGSVTTPVGFPNYLGMTVASAVTVGASDYFAIAQSIEGFNFADLAWGTANAKTITLSFQVYSSLTGTFGGALINSAANRSYPFSYTVSSANTWTSISVTIAGDTTGTWVGSTNGIGVSVRFGLGAGSTFSGTAGAWATGNYISPTGAVSVVGTASATFYLTSVQLEVGTVATPFERLQYGTEFALCQRYFNKLGGAATGDIVVGGYGAATGGIYTSLYYPVQMRAVPTTTTIVGTWTATNCGQPLLFGAGSSSLSVYAIVTTLGGAIVNTSGTSTYITNSAEL